MHFQSFHLINKELGNCLVFSTSQQHFNSDSNSIRTFLKNSLNFLVFQGKASKRKNVLDEAYGQQGFLADSRDLVNFCVFPKILEIAFQILY